MSLVIQLYAILESSSLDSLRLQMICNDYFEWLLEIAGKSLFCSALCWSFKGCILEQKMEHFKKKILMSIWYLENCLFHQCGTVEWADDESLSEATVIHFYLLKSHPIIHLHRPQHCLTSATSADPIKRNQILTDTVNYHVGQRRAEWRKMHIHKIWKIFNII